MEATARARELMPKVLPSSPSVALFRNGALVYVLERRQIERMNASEIAAELAKAFSQHCSRQGPSVSPDVYGQVVHARQCGSQIPALEADEKGLHDLPALSFGDADVSTTRLCDRRKGKSEDRSTFHVKY